MELYYSFATLIVIATIFSYINKQYLKLPDTIGVMVLAMGASLVIVLAGVCFDKSPLPHLASMLNNFDFSEILMGGMLNFLLFAGAIHINLQDLKEQKLPIIVFSSLSVVISTLVVGFGLYYLSNFLLPMAGIYIEIPLVFCLLFGALISPTDPIAVLAILKDAKVSKSVETKVAGESLFNDGVAVVVFAVILSMTQSVSEEIDIEWGATLWLLFKEVFGGVTLGLVLGHLAWYGMRTALDMKISVLITLSVVMGGYLAAGAMHISGPLAMVVAGLIIGDSRRKGLDNKKITSNNLNIFWQLIDEVLNAILFLFIGLELLLIPDLIMDYWLIGLFSILIVLFARFVSIKIPTLIIPFKDKFNKATIFILVWGGLRGAVSIALALSIPEGPYKKIIIAITYCVVVFSILVQGLSIGKLANKTNKN